MIRAIDKESARHLSGDPRHGGQHGIVFVPVRDIIYIIYIKFFHVRVTAFLYDNNIIILFTKNRAQSPRHFSNIKRLGDMRVHARVQSGLNILFECVGGHGDNGNFRQFRIG